jgi:hypothetical protein
MREMSAAFYYSYESVAYYPAPRIPFDPYQPLAPINGNIDLCSNPAIARAEREQLSWVDS